jgi:Protein of unknown function (DUF3833)
MLSRRAFFVLPALPVAACAGPPRLETTARGRPVILERFFLGRTVGEGGFTSSVAGIDRRLRVVTRGTWDGRTLTLVEDFFFADGERDRKTWRFTKTGEGRYEGTREDVIGKADIRQQGDVVTLTYTADVRGRDGGVTRLDFADTIARIDDRRVRNKATVSRFGIPVATVDLIFSRTTPA